MHVSSELVRQNDTTRKAETKSEREDNGTIARRLDA
jgi:hypothetical protein